MARKIAFTPKNVLTLASQLMEGKRYNKFVLDLDFFHKVQYLEMSYLEETSRYYQMDTKERGMHLYFLTLCEISQGWTHKE